MHPDEVYCHNCHKWTRAPTSDVTGDILRNPKCPTCNKILFEALVIRRRRQIRDERHRKGANNG